MQISSFSVFAQVITGPNTARYGMSATYYIDNPSPDVKYHWTTVDSTGYITNPYTNNTNNHKVDIGWVSYAEKTIVVTEEPLFPANTLNVSDFGATRASNDTLYDYYVAMQNEIIEQINTTDTRLAELIAAMESQNYYLYLQRMEAAAQSNSNIVSDEDQENNEAGINEIFLKVLELGIDSLTSDDSTFLVQLAAQCPYIGGTAVYKARMLIAMYQPLSMYDDIKLCNTIGVYKTNNSNGSTKGIFDDENIYLRSLKPKPENRILGENELVIYPNPANDQLNLRYRYSKDSKLQIVNIMGIVVKEIFLPKETQNVSLLVNDLITGVYTYRQIENKILLRTGKLIISN